MPRGFAATVFLAWVLLPVSALAAQPAPATLITNLGARAFTSLDGSWSVIVDPYETGLGSRAFLTPTPKTKSDLVEFDFTVAGTLKVPGDWNTQRQELLFYEGPLW